MIRVGQKRLNGKEYTYSDVKYDELKWADAKQYLPAKYDLVLLKTSSSTKPGWYTGNGWDGLRVDSDAEVLYWKKIE